MLIAGLVLFPLVVLKLPSTILPDDVTLVLDRGLVLTFVLVVPLVVDRVGDLAVLLVVPLVVVTVEGGGRSSNAGALLSG
jgi:hypothetical protein